MSYRRNYSGQFLYFSLASVFSGTPITSGAGGVSGRRSIDGAAQSLISGTIGEIGGGQYVARLYDFDTDGNQIGFLFTASGAVAVNYTITTDGLSSGRTFLASGSQVSLLSGNTVSLYSGQQVNVYSGQLSGHAVNLLSGNQVAVVSGTQVNAFSGQVYPNSGLATSLLSGAAGENAFASGILDRRIPRAVLVYDFTGASGVIASGMSGRCLLNASRKLTNKFSLTASSGYLTAYMEDDTSVAYRQALTSVSGAAPVTGLDTE